MSKTTKRIKLLSLKFYFFIKRIIDISLGFFITRSKFIKGNKCTIYLVGTPEHDNLGDHAIALAEYMFIGKYLSNYCIIEITIEKFYRYLVNLIINVNENDIFMLTGGGNIGNIYLPDEKSRRLIIKHFPKNKIIIMPQTIYFSEDRKGNREFNKSVRIYNSHKNLFICARENYSYEKMKKAFYRCNILLCPDMVFLLNYSIKKYTRVDFGLCLRKDIERSLTDSQHETIYETLGNISIPITDINTCLPSGIIPEEREKEIKTLLDKFSKCKIMITDRLHGMIFSVITGTPCIVFCNFNYKIIGSYEWVSKFPYIKLLDNTDNLLEVINELLSIDNNFYYENVFFPYYKRLSDSILGKPE